MRPGLRWFGPIALLLAGAALLVYALAQRDELWLLQAYGTWIAAIAWTLALIVARLRRSRGNPMP